MKLSAWLVSALMVVTGTAAADEGVLVLGGTGRLGAAIVELLADRGEDVTVFARPGSSRHRLQGLDVQYATGDLLDAESVATAFAGKAYRVIIDASARGATREPFYDTVMANVLRAANGQRVQQFILHGSIGAGANGARFPNANWSRMRDVLDAKGRAEHMLIDSGIGYTIIRNGLIQRDGTPATRSAYLTEDTDVFGATTRADLALLTIQCLDKDACLNKVLHAVDDSFAVPDAFRN